MWFQQTGKKDDINTNNRLSYCIGTSNLNTSSNPSDSVNTTKILQLVEHNSPA